MSFKAVAIAAVLSALPVLASAQCSWGRQDTAASCPQGTTWSADAARCVSVTTS